MARKSKINSDIDKAVKALKPPDEQDYGDDNLQVSSRMIPYGTGLFNGFRGGISHLYYTGRNISPYGVDPKYRDYQLWNCVNTNGWLSSTKRNITIRLTNVPYEIRAKNPSVISHVETAKRFNEVFWEGNSLIEESEGWNDVKDRFSSNVIGQDNGGVLEILDDIDNIDRDASLPRLGFGGFRFWDSSQVIRKKDKEYPVAIQYKPEGEQRYKQYRLHKTRVFSIVDDESPKPELNGIGFCAVSRALEFAMDLANLTETKNENYGDGEPDQIWTLTSNAIPQVADGSTFLDQIENKYRMARSNTATQKTARRLKLELPEGSDFSVDNARTLPDGFNETETIENAMKGMASAFNVPLRFIWTITTRGLGDAAAADLDEEIARSGIFTWFTDQVTRLVRQKIIPKTLDIVVATENDKHDERASEIENNLTQSNSQQLADGAIDIRTYRLSLLDAGKLSESEFIRLELEDGRMRDGKPVLDAFYNPQFADILTIDGVIDALDVDTNASAELIDLLGDKAREVKRLRESIIEDGRRVSERDRLLIAHTALTRLQSLYMDRLQALETDMDDTRPEQDTGEQVEDKAVNQFKPDYGIDFKIMDGKRYLFGQEFVYVEELTDDLIAKKKATKAVNDDLDLYQRKLEEILLKTNNGEIDEDESQERISALASAMLIIAFLLGKREREDRLTTEESALIAGARQILNNGGITQPDFTESQLARFNEGLAIINDADLKAEVFTFDELQLLNEQILINQESSGGVVDWALNLTPVLVGLGLLGREFDDELRSRIANRVNLWRNKASIFVDVGRVAVRPNTLFQWRIGATEENCATCLFYNGQIKTGLEWFRLAVNQGIYPRSSALECGGWNCLCNTIRLQNQ